jgi:hypothetical protein
MGGRCASAEVVGEATWGVATIKDREAGARFFWEVLQGKLERGVITQRQGEQTLGLEHAQHALFVT